MFLIKHTLLSNSFNLANFCTRCSYNISPPLHARACCSSPYYKLHKSKMGGSDTTPTNFGRSITIEECAKSGADFGSECA